MSIRFSCSCGRKLKVSDEKIGMKVLCSSCGATLKVPKKPQDEYWQDVLNGCIRVAVVTLRRNPSQLRL